MPRRWDAARPQRWSGWRRALGNCRRPLHALPALSTFRKAASSWLCRRSWLAGSCGILPSIFTCRLAFTVSQASFCFWPSWRWAGSGRLRHCAITRRTPHPFASAFFVPSPDFFRAFWLTTRRVVWVGLLGHRSRLCAPASGTTRCAGLLGRCRWRLSAWTWCAAVLLPCTDGELRHKLAQLALRQ